jgi:hypothetical protein
MYFGKPVIATGYSGNLEFMTPHNSYLVDYSLTRIGEGSDPYPVEGVWAQPDLEHAAQLMQHVFNDRAESNARGERAAAEIRAKHSPEMAGRSYMQRLRHVTGRKPPRALAVTEPTIPEPAREASDLIAQGPPPPPKGNPARNLVRRLTLRFMRPWTNHVVKVERRLVQSIEELTARHQTLANELDTKFARSAKDLTGAQAGLLADMRRVETALRHQDAVSHADAVARLDALEENLRRPTGALSRRAEPLTSMPLRQPMHDPHAGAVVGYSNGEPNGGIRLEDLFSPPEEVVRQRLRRYLPWIGPGPAVDLRAGRGELLDVLREQGVDYSGVDSDPAMVDICRSKGHDQVDVAAPLDRLRAAADASLGAIFAARLLEELARDQLVELLELAALKLRRGGVLIAENTNPYSVEAMRTMWVDLRTRRPVHPEVALALCRAGGYGSAFYFHPNGTGDVEVDGPREREFAIVATR